MGMLIHTHRFASVCDLRTDVHMNGMLACLTDALSNWMSICITTNVNMILAKTVPPTAHITFTAHGKHGVVKVINANIRIHTFCFRVTATLSAPSN